MQHTDIFEIMKGGALIGQKITVCGWVRTSRDSKNMAFIELNDGTSLRHIQLVIDKDGNYVRTIYHYTGADIFNIKRKKSRLRKSMEKQPR